MTTWSKSATFAALVAVTLAPSVQRLLMPEASQPATTGEGPGVVRASAETLVLPTVAPMPAAPVYSDAAKDPAAISNAFEAVAAVKPTAPAPAPIAASPRLAETTVLAALTPAKPSSVEEPPEPAKPTESPSRAALEDLVRAEAARKGMPAEIAFAVVSVGSAWDPKKKGGEGEIGLMQVVPRIARQFGFKGADSALWDPATNVKWGMAYVGGAYKKAGGDLCRTAMKISGGHYVNDMQPQHRAYCDKLKAALTADGHGDLAKAAE